MKINGELSVFLGAIIIWLLALSRACDAIMAGASENWPSCLWNAYVSISLVWIGVRVWRAA